MESRYRALIEHYNHHLSMALNWVQTTAKGDKPVPLPQEKIFLSIENCNLSLEFSSTKQRWTADGTAFVTSQRIIFLRQPPLPAPASMDPSTPSQHLRSLSVPIERLLEARYMIPIFASPYYEARVLPVRDSGLPQPVRQQGVDGNDAAGLGLLKLWFGEGGGIQFREAVEEVKARLDEQGGKLNHLEQLPSYEPPPSPLGPSRTTSTASIDRAQPPLEALSHTPLNAPSENSSAVNSSTATSTSDMTTPPTNAGSTATARRKPQRNGTLPPDSEDLEAARIAREIEERENLERLNRDQNQPPPDATQQTGADHRGVPVSTLDGDGAPPGYEEACER